MKRKPEREETNDRPGEIPCTFRIWIEPDDLSWEQLNDESVCGKEPPDGWESWCVIVEAVYSVSEDGYPFNFSGIDSLGGIQWIPGSGTYADFQKFLDEEIEEVKREAYGSLVVDIRAAADGTNLDMAKAEKRAAERLLSTV